MGRFINLAGEKVGLLTVIGRSESVKGRTMWLCRCDCGNERIATSSVLVRNHIKSCGCIRPGKSPERNEYEIRGEITAIIINSEKYGKHETLISTSKLERFKDFPRKWGLRWDPKLKSFYAKAPLLNTNGKQQSITLHRWITSAPAGMVVDHINHDTLDNTDSNLRIVTTSENAQNRKGVPSNNASGVIGVSWDKKSNKWRVQVGVNNTRKYVGLFDNFEEAEQASVEARMHHMPYSQEASL